MFANEKLNIRSNRSTGSQSAMDFIKYIKELEAANDQLTSQNKKLLRERDSARAVAKSKADMVTKLQIGLARAAGDVDRLKEENKILRKVAKDLHARVKSWQTMAKNQFRKNKKLEIEAICTECELDEAYDRIRQLEEGLAEKDVIIDEIIVCVEEAADDWANVAEEAESKAYRLEAELAEKNWIISQQKDQLDAYKIWEELTTMGSILQVVTEIAGYEIESAFIEDWENRSVEYEIKHLDLRDEIISGLGYIAEESTELYLLAKSEAVIDGLEDKLDEIQDVCDRILYPFQLCE